MTNTDCAVVVDGLAKRYRHRVAVADVSFCVRPGETFGLLGPNGAGKTTTIETIAGLRRADSGIVRVLGLDPRRDRARVRQILGVQLQEAFLHGALRLDELLSLYRSFYADPRSADEVLEMVGLTEDRRVRFEKLSGGQQQRFSIALALVGRPRVLILDELTTGLDPSARRRIWAMIESLKAEGVTILLVSHAMEEVERLCDRIAVLVGGRVVASGTTREVIDEAGATDLDDAFVSIAGTTMEAAS